MGKDFSCVSSGVLDKYKPNVSVYQHSPDFGPKSSTSNSLPCCPIVIECIASVKSTDLLEDGFEEGGTK